MLKIPEKVIKLRELNRGCEFCLWSLRISNQDKKPSRASETVP